MVKILAGFAIFVSASLLPAIAAPARAESFDGRWWVSIVKTEGACDVVSVAEPVRVAGGRVLNDELDTHGAHVNGNVAPDGAIKVRVTRVANGEALSADAVGRLEGKRAGGSWTSVKPACKGTWSAKRDGEG
ncbi:MAG: hypothetical protein U1E28_22190 [Beijerinckiaceae bacterium]